MDTSSLQNWIALNPIISASLASLALVIIYLLARLIFGRGLTHLAKVTRNKVDDVIIKKLRPYRASLLAPFIVAYIFSDLSPLAAETIRTISLFIILWLSILTINGLVDAGNQVYESSPSFTGVSIQGYLDIARLFILLVGVILSISLLTGESPLVLLGGLGAITAVLLLVFHDTIMALIASIQISAHNLVREGDWLEVPSYDADGEVLNMSLHTIKIQNWDKTITVIPTHKIIDTSYKNWRGMQESGGRRIMRSITLDQNSVRFCSPEMIERFARIDLIADQVSAHRTLLTEYEQQHGPLDSTLDGPQVTNVEFFRAYITAYLRNQPEINSEKMDFIVRELAPSPTGLPVEIYVFTRTTRWADYERIQASIIDHLLAAAPSFDLRLFQQPAGSDFANALRA